MRTAELAGLTGARPDPDLLEWDYGGYEGLTAAQIQETRPGWDLWRDGVVPGDVAHPGEELQQVAARTDAVLGRVRPLLDEGDVAVVAHGHLARLLTVRWLGLDASAGRLLGHPHPGTLSFLDNPDHRPRPSRPHPPPHLLKLRLEKAQWRAVRTRQSSRAAEAAARRAAPPRPRSLTDIPLVSVEAEQTPVVVRVARSPPPGHQFTYGSGRSPGAGRAPHRGYRASSGEVSSDRNGRRRD